MHLLEKPVDYSKAEEFNREVNKLTLESAKVLVKKLYEDNRNYKQLAARAAITVEQYKHLLSVFDGYSEDKENMGEVGNCFRKLLVGTFEASRNLSFWVKTLCEASKRIVFEDNNVADVFSLVGNVCCEIYANSCEVKARKILLPEEPAGVCVRNLERTEEDDIENPPRGFYSHQSVLINRQEENTNSVHKTDKRSHQQHEKSTVNDEITSLRGDGEDDDDDDDARSGEESDNSSTILKQSASTCENDDSEGGECSYDKETQENFEKRNEKTFAITYPKSQNLFKRDVIHSKKSCSNISAKCDESEHSDQLTKSDDDINEDNQSLSENDMTKDIDKYSGVISSKIPSKYKRKHHVNKQEGNVTKRGRKKRKSNASQNSDTVAKKPRRYRRSYDSITFENSDVVKDIDDSEIVIHHSSSSSSKRYQRSNGTSNIHKTELGKTSFRKKGQNVKKHDSGSEAGAEISSVKSKRNRRGRRRKLSGTLEQETNKTFKSRNKGESASFKNVPQYSDNVIKRAYVRLSNVLDDPEAQHYIDVIQYKERKESECGSGVRWKERTETEETSSNKERNEMEALQEWNVLDAVSDEDDKEFENTEDVEETSNNDNHQASDSDAEQEETINDGDDDDDDKGQLEIDYSDRELEASSDGEHEESCAAKQDSNRNQDSDNESKEHKKGPSTPDVSPHESEYEDNSDVQDENDGDADSVKSNDEEDISSSRPTSSSPIYGKKGPRTPPSPAPFEPLRRGPQTPPGSGPDHEGSKELESSPSQLEEGDEGPVLTVMDDSEKDSSDDSSN